MRSETVTTIVSAPRDAVFEYMSDIEKLPEWATEFARELKRDGENYKVLNGLGEFYFDIQADPRTGVIDMFAGTTKDQMAVFPTRAVELPDGQTAYSFTMFQGPTPIAATRIRQHPRSLLLDGDHDPGTKRDAHGPPMRTASGCTTRVDRHNATRRPRRPRPLRARPRSQHPGRPTDLAPADRHPSDGQPHSRSQLTSTALVTTAAIRTTGLSFASRRQTEASCARHPTEKGRAT